MGHINLGRKGGVLSLGRGENIGLISIFYLFLSLYLSFNSIHQIQVIFSNMLGLSLAQSSFEIQIIDLELLFLQFFF